ncbi:MAG: hypothetical protein D6805_07300 [Planctomycetota bacterium]|nr:MAG: hypothetical protein D6805_07300 [Planctomycetota bacterium]
MITICKVEELSDEIIHNEILRLLRAEAEIILSKGSRLLGDFQFSFSDEELLQGPMGRYMQMVFDYVRKRANYDPMEVSTYCMSIIEFIWPSQFGSNYSIPEEFWDTPMGFAIYEVIGKIKEPPKNKELSSVQAAKFLGIPLSQFHLLVEKGLIPISRKEGKNPRYLIADLEKVKNQISKNPKSFL